MNINITIVIEADENGYYAYCPELQGCQSNRHRETLEDTQNNIRKDNQKLCSLYWL
jgi:predicted RNase H-like HicB family nuclease